MQIKRSIRFRDQWIPPRCRIPRYRECEMIVRANIPEVTITEAPVAIVQRGDSRFNVEHIGFRNRIQFHLWNGRLFARIKWSRFICLNGKKDRQAKVSDIYYDGWQGFGDAAKQQADFERFVSQFLIIDGKLCIEVDEPRYCVHTGGLGCNHGGTYLMTEYGYNSNISHTRYVRCDEPQQAVELHRKIAKARGDTKSLPCRGYARFDILIPEAVKLNPAKEHGNGDPFINKVEGIIEGVKDPMIAGLAGIMMAFKAA